MYRFSKVIVLFLVLTFPDYGFGADKELGEIRYKESCVSCHGQAGKGAASYPKISGNEVSFTMEKLRAYREGIKQGPNSALMIMMAKPLTDEEIENLAAYLEDATYEVQ
ncbi:MAG: c-type cytochrome [Paracoccaceae bacterium]|nr:c-type cytochrome [Paracoccaceae bacterium]